MAVQILDAIKRRDIVPYSRHYEEIQKLNQDKKRTAEVEQYLNWLHNSMPTLVDDMRRTCEEAYWENRVQIIYDAFHWSQAKKWLEEYIRKDDALNLDVRVKQIDDEINTHIAEIASLRAWDYCCSRLLESHRRHMIAWKQEIDKGGKFTGRHASKHRREAQKYLNQFRDAVPAWVMPLHRVWDTVAPSPGMFDVVIVDEASQCGLESLPLLYLGKKILIVGDDKQISPEAVGLDRNKMFRLMEDYLYDFEYKSSFDVETSLFHHGRLRHSTHHIALREHFRCMPEIIRFSNDLCYSDTPLIPLRQYGPDRLSPLEHVFVNNGYREGSNSRVINRPEAEAIADKIVELCRDSQYDGKSIGVIVLQGEAQASLIEDMLLKQLDSEEISNRRLLCGNPYSFQGDHGDIIFLSMVAASNERIGSLAKPSDERRFNVAASRAKDQMWLFYSVKQDDLSEHDLRRRLLEFFENPNQLEIAGIDKQELEERAFQDNRSLIQPPSPFESWFEVDVALELLRKNYNIIPQYKIAGKRIDLVVECGQARMAIECDGDKWHGIDKYEDDMRRQRMLERCGWEFFRIRESAFYSDKENTLCPLWHLLEQRHISKRIIQAPDGDAIHNS